MLVCRFCMTQNDVDIDLFQSALYSKLVCLPVQIADNDILPKRICHQCETKVYNFYSFWRCVQDVEKELLSQIDSDKIILDSDDVMLSPDTQIVSNSVKTSSLSRSTMTLRSSVPNKSSASTINKATSSIQNNNNNNNNNSINDEHQLLASDQDLNSMPTSPNQSNHNFAVDGVEYNKNEIETDPDYDLVSNSGSDLDYKDNEKKPKKILNNNDEIYNCIDCNKTFATRKQYSSHIYRVHKERKVRCEVCGKEMRKISLIEHVKKHKGEQTIHVCPWEGCKKKFFSKGSLTIHIRQHKNQYMECRICSKKFITKACLQDHEKIHIDSDKRDLLQCRLCNKAFRHRNSLHTHIKSLHLMEHHQCEVCGKVVMSKSSLKAHLIIHENKRPYICEFCGSSFNNKGSLRTHRYKHLNILPHTCKECGKGFVQSSNYVRHMRTHTGEKPYKCKLCDETFAQRNSLKHHEKRH